MEYQNPFLEQETDLKEYFRVIFGRKWLIISFTLIVCTLALIRSYMMHPVYGATTRLLIEKESPNIVKIEEVSSMDFSTREYYQTQCNVLKSNTIALRVNKGLGGYVPWNEWTARESRNDENPLTEVKRIESLLKRVKVSAVPNTQLVQINVEDIDPQLSKKIANMWAEKYISYVLDSKFDATKYASEWLESKIRESKDNLENSEIKLQEYRIENNIVAGGNEDNKESEVLTALLNRKSELEIELSSSLEYYKEKHPEIIGLKSEISSVARKIAIEKQKEMLTKDKEIQYNILNREAEMNRNVYESLVERIKETEITGELKTTNIRIIDRATLPEKPVRPRKKTSLIIAFLIGIFGGTGLAFLFNGMDQSIKTPEDVKMYVKLPLLASISVPRDSKDKKVQMEFISFLRPRSTISEAYCSLRTSLMFTAVEHRRKTLLFTSSGPQEGKTTSAINLAIVMAQAGEKTLLVDADLRQPRVEKAFNIDPENGLTEILAGSVNIKDTIHKTEIENLDVIACGSIPPNPSELLGSMRMDEFLVTAGQKYDRIIIDTPPILAVTDAVILSGKVDGAILVVKAGDTNRNAALKTKEIIETVQTANIVGVVLNMVDVARSGGYYYYHHYYGKKYGHYGKDTSKKNSVK